MIHNSERQLELSGLEIDVTVIGGRGLVAKDRKAFGLGKKSTSDPFCKIVLGGKVWAKTKTVDKTLDPTWNQSFQLCLNTKETQMLVASRDDLFIHIFDEDLMSEPDYMGGVAIPILPLISGAPPTTDWYPVQKTITQCRSPFYGTCKNATGDIQVKIAVTAKRVLSLVKGNSKVLDPNSMIRVGLGWEMENRREIDLDTSCVAIDSSGNVIMDETVYFGDLVNSNGSIRHTGDEREGDENIGGTGDDEVIFVRLSTISRRVCALYFIATVASPDKTFSDVQSARVNVDETRSGYRLCHFIPALTGAQTSMFLMRIARQGSSWVLSIIGDTTPSARDFGSLIPEIKGYSRDICPSIQNIDPHERIAIMRKNGTIQLQDYTNKRHFVFGLAWDVTHGVNIDLDASAICLDASLNPVDIVWFRQLKSKDGSIIHSGDEREGDSVGDDEKMTIHLDQVQENVAYIGFVVNSYSGQELDDVARASCHLYDASSGADIARYQLSNGKELDKRTALVMGCLYRESMGGNWNLRIISEPAHGRTAADNVDELQRFLRAHPPQPFSSPPDPEIIVNAMPSPVPIEEDEIIVGPFIP